MLDGVMLLWFLLTAASLLFVAVDIRATPESPVLKWGFVLLTAYTGVVGAFLYVLGCREPLPGLHERYVAARWRQALGSTMHCVAGDGIGILAGAVLSGAFGISGLAEVALEYILGFAFGWTIFQALFHARHGRRLISTRADRNLRVGTAVDESPDGGNGADSDDAEGADTGGGRSNDAQLLVRDVHGAPGRIPLCLSHKLVAGGPPLEARHDDGAPDGRGCSGRPRSSRRHGYDAASCAGDAHGRRCEAVASGAGDGAAVVSGAGGRDRGCPAVATHVKRMGVHGLHGRPPAE